MKKLIYNPALKTVSYENASTNTGLEMMAVLCTYEGLKFLRDNSMLEAGVSYRITDYKCTSAQENTKAADNQFDIIVRAIDGDTLSEQALAAHHAGDEYFAKSNLSAWKIDYCLDNNTQRFAWADATNGRGVIYRMIDEFNNDCPYDFKNIMFWRDADTVEGMTDGYYYTFSWQHKIGEDEVIEIADASVFFINNISLNDENFREFISDNILKAYINGYYGLDADKYHLNACVFFSDCDFDLFYGVKNNTFGNNCHNNTFGNNCHNNTFGNDCSDNTFGNNCHDNTFGNNCSGNTFGNSCNNNTFGNNCNSNTFGNYCQSNTFGNYCQSNTFAANTRNNSFGDFYSNHTHATAVEDYLFWDSSTH